jgi:hypothetical protein
MLSLAIPLIGKVVQLDIDGNVMAPGALLFLYLLSAVLVPGTVTRSRRKGH